MFSYATCDDFFFFYARTKKINSENLLQVNNVEIYHDTGRKICSLIRKLRFYLKKQFFV